ncbi:hypothetical protein V2G26_011375 [Clonostachys chloroleuca]
MTYEKPLVPTMHAWISVPDVHVSGSWHHQRPSPTKIRNHQQPQHVLIAGHKCRGRKRGPNKQSLAYAYLENYMHWCAAANQRQTECWGRVFGRICEATGDPIIGDGLHKKQASKVSEDFFPP